MLYRMFSNTLGSTLEMPVTTPPTNVTIKNVFRHCQMFPGKGAKIAPSLTTTALRDLAFVETLEFFCKGKQIMLSPA